MGCFEGLKFEVGEKMRTMKIRSYMIAILTEIWIPVMLFG